ncbi:MAG: hypothetical protein U0R44_05290 [Candidatus Micrarchaeia archaeon]
MLVIGLVCAFSAVSFASSSCNDSYDQCITSCCDSCGSTLSTDANGDLVCDVGTQSHQNQGCIDACTPCANAYQQCIKSEGAAGTGYPSGSSCCGSAALLGSVLGAVFLRW